MNMSFIDNSIKKFKEFEKGINNFCENNKNKNNELIDLELESIRANIKEGRSLLVILKSLVVEIDKSVEIINKEKGIGRINKEDVDDYLKNNSVGHEDEWKIVCDCSIGVTGVKGEYKLDNKTYSYFLLSGIMKLTDFGEKDYYAFPRGCLIYTTLVAIENHLGMVYLVEK